MLLFLPFFLHFVLSSFLQTVILNKHLQNLMNGLTAKVFRTYNASITLQEQLKALTNREFLRVCVAPSCHVGAVGSDVHPLPHCPHNCLHEVKLPAQW